ncbi:carboxypeptidase-like regulatory domain-containing protein [Aureibaculum luteum]|uniref:carboxypeptidase-like regulatory domain-containing protein n=1 Tax=Aureibaculum luteum TaxID=1548456 RepID=UPI000E4D50DD|nr:carboxypeptidase-like regulatory domain-containing protein [Aureibaculum luteum]
MKISIITKSLLVLILTISSIFCSGQTTTTTIEGYVFDKVTKTPLPYAVVIFTNTGVYATCNEDGKFQISTNRDIELLEIRYLGYQSKKVSKDFFSLNSILYLEESSTNLKEVVLNASKEDLYKLLYKLIKKYRRKNDVINNKAYFNLSSKTGDVPLEHFDGLYNSSQQLSKGISRLDLKTGRFGQNKLFPFYSLNYVYLLRNFSLFGNINHMLPQYPGNMSLSEIKKYYNLKLITKGNDHDVAISFLPKDENKEVFSGELLFQKEELILKKIEIFIEHPNRFKLMPIVKNDSSSINKLNLNVIFNPIDFNRIQYFNIEFDLNYYSGYHSGKTKKNIKTTAILYLYDYDDQFTKPYFTNTIKFTNDYEKLLALPISNKIWNENYPYPKSEENIEIVDFFKERNYLHSYIESEIPLKAAVYITRSSLLWSNERKLTFGDLANGPGVNLNFSYALNFFENSDDKFIYTLKTLFDRESSFFLATRYAPDIDRINLAFDIYELYRCHLLEQINASMSIQEIKDLSNTVSLKAKILVNQMLFETVLIIGSEILSESEIFFKAQVLNKWKDKIHNELDKYRLDSNKNGAE